MANLIIIFTLNGCSHCTELKKKLTLNKIKYNEIEVGGNPKIWDKVVEQTGFNTLPTVYVALGEGDEGPVFVPERDYENHDELIEKLKKYL
jgi:hypothetical protein